MDHRDAKRSTTPGRRPPDRNPDAGRRMDPRWWLLPPILALCILGAYFLGQVMKPEPSEGQAQPVAQQPALQPAPAPPMGHISVTEVPRATAAPAVPAAPPPVAPSQPPAASNQAPYHKVEPPVVLPPPSEPAPSADAPTSDTTPPVEQQPSADDGTLEPDRDPRKLNEPALEYPSSAYEAGVEGAAQVAYTVSADGKVKDVSIAASSGDSRLDQAAMDYVRRLRFRPGIRGGKPADVRTSRSVRFQLH